MSKLSLTLILLSLFTTNCVSENYTRTLASDSELKVGPSLTLVASGLTQDLLSIHGKGSEIWAVGPNAVIRFKDPAFEGVYVSESNLNNYAGCPDRAFRGVWVNSPDDVWIGCTNESSDGAIAHFDGLNWNYLPLHANRAVNSLWSPGPGDVWAVGGNYAGATLLPDQSVSGYLGHYDGHVWQKVGLDLSANAIFGRQTGELWTLCGGGQICLDQIDNLLSAPVTDRADFFEALDVAPEPVHVKKFEARTTLTGLWVDSRGEVWAVGLKGQVVHFTGKTWRIEAVGLTTANLRAVSGYKSEVWAVGEGGTILYFDGARWSALKAPVSSALYSVWARGRGEAWIAGEAGVVLRSQR